MLKHARKVKQFTVVVNPFTRNAGKLSAMNLGERIKQARKAAGKTQKELAAEVGCKRETVAMWETGKVEKVGGEYLTPLCKVLGINPEWLQTGKGQKAPQNGTAQSAVTDKAQALQHIVTAMAVIMARLRPEEAAAVLALLHSQPEALATIEKGEAQEVLNAVEKVLRLRVVNRRSE